MLGQSKRRDVERSRIVRRSGVSRFTRVVTPRVGPAVAVVADDDRVTRKVGKLIVVGIYGVTSGDDSILKHTHRLSCVNFDRKFKHEGITNRQPRELRCVDDLSVGSAVEVCTIESDRTYTCRIGHESQSTDSNEGSAKLAGEVFGQSQIGQVDVPGVFNRDQVVGFKVAIGKLEW